MSINFYKTIILFVFCLISLSPINLQAYCQYQDCGGSGNLEEAPLTLQEAQGLKDFYTAVERDLSENTEVLQDGSYQVTFSEDLTLGVGVWASIKKAGLAHYVPNPHANALFSGEIIFEQNTETLKRYFSDKSHVSIKETGNTMLIDVKSPRGKHAVQIGYMVKSDHNSYVLENSISYYRKVGKTWVEAKNYSTLDFIEIEKKEYLRQIDNLVTSLQSDDPQVFRNYLRARGIRFTGAVIAKRTVNAAKFVGRWTLRAVLATAGIVGGYLAYDYAQENHPDETDLVINITKEQWENLSIKVGEIVEYLSQNALDELEL